MCEISQSFAADVRACIAESARDDSAAATTALTFFNTENIKVKNKIRIKIITITPNSSEITDII